MMTTKAEKETEPTFPLYQLREHSQELFDGVFSTAKEAELSKTEAKRRITAFLKREVK